MLLPSQRLMPISPWERASDVAIERAGVIFVQYDLNGIGKTLTLNLAVIHKEYISINLLESTKSTKNMKGIFYIRKNPIKLLEHVLMYTKIKRPDFRKNGMRKKSLPQHLTISPGLPFRCAPWQPVTSAVMRNIR